jgi:hypothetical protein
MWAQPRIPMEVIVSSWATGFRQAAHAAPMIAFFENSV